MKKAPMYKPSHILAGFAADAGTKKPVSDAPSGPSKDAIRAMLVEAARNTALLCSSGAK